MNKRDEQHNVQAFWSGSLVSMVTRQPFSCLKWPLKHLFHNKEKIESQKRIESSQFAIILDATTQAAKFAGICVQFTCFHGNLATIFFLKMAAKTRFHEKAMVKPQRSQ